VPVLRRSALSVRGTKLRISSGEDASRPDLGGSDRDHRPQRGMLENGEADRDASAEGATVRATGYALDPSDPEVLLLLRPDGTTAGPCSAPGT
jgi:hypothetical protein